jgi:hypothetical protein
VRSIKRALGAMREISFVEEAELVELISAFGAMQDQREER